MTAGKNWFTKDGRAIPIATMSTDHLENILTWMSRVWGPLSDAELHFAADMIADKGGGCYWHYPMTEEAFVPTRLQCFEAIFPQYRTLYMEAVTRRLIIPSNLPDFPYGVNAP